MSNYLMYLDETGDFSKQKSKTDEWIVGGLYGEITKQYTSDSKKLEAQIQSSILGTNSLHATELTSKQRRAILQRAIPFIQKHRLTMVMTYYISDRYTSDKTHPNLRYNHMIMENIANMVGRLPKTQASALELKIENSGERFNKQIFKANWQALQDLEIILPQTSLHHMFYNKIEPEYPFLLGISDLILHFYRNPTRRQFLLEQFDLHKIPLFVFAYNSTAIASPQKLYEDFFSAYLHKNTVQLLECFALLDHALSHQCQSFPPESIQTYQHFAQQILNQAFSLIKKSKADSQEALKWINTVLENKQVARYQYLEALFSHLTKSTCTGELYNKCYRQWTSHQGKIVLQPHSAPTQLPENVLGMLNGESVKLIHSFEFSKALNQVEAICQVRQQFLTQVQSLKPQTKMEDPWLGIFLSQRAQFKSYLNQPDAALQDFSQALDLFAVDDFKNRSQTLCHGTLAAIETQDRTLVQSWVEQLLQHHQITQAQEILKSLKNYHHKIEAKQLAFVLRALLKSQLLLQDSSLNQTLLSVTESSVSDLFKQLKKSAYHPIEMILLTWARLTFQEQPERATDLLLCVADLHTNPDTVLYYVSVSALMWQSVLFNDPEPVEEAIQRLITAAGNRRSILNHDQTTGWFAPVFKVSDPLQQAQTYVNLMSFGLS